MVERENSYEIVIRKTFDDGGVVFRQEASSFQIHQNRGYEKTDEGIEMEDTTHLRIDATFVHGVEPVPNKEGS